MTTAMQRVVAFAISGLLAATCMCGCGPKAEEPDVVVAPPATNKVEINNTVIVPVPNTATNVVVKPVEKHETKVINKSTTVVVATPKLPPPAPQSAGKTGTRPAPTASWKPPPPPGPRLGAAPPGGAKAPPPYTQITPAPAQGNTGAVPATATPLVVQGRIVAVSKIPDINNAPYQEALYYVKYKVLAVEKGEYKKKELMAAHLAMQKKKLLPAARYKVGETQRLELVPLSDRPDLERTMTWDTINDINLSPYFVAKVG